ncbi:MAG: GDP-mannose 4,6-dehydratase [Candidatus Gastranaerophilaceae bacterium]
MNILITGGAGFIGSNLAEKLIKDHNIIVIDNFNDYYSPAIKENNIKEILNNPKYKLYRADVRNIEEIKPVFSENSIDCVVHIAASAGVRASIKEPDLFIKNNICATVNVLELMKDFNVKKLVFASSSSVYGNCKAEKFSEDLKITEPISPYAATKSACEQFIYTFSKLYDIQAVCLRFFTVYGRRQRPDLAISKFVNLIKQDKPIPVYGDGTTYRDYTYIDDILSGIESAIYYNKTPYEIINLGGGEPVTLIDMIKTIEQVLGKKAQIEWLPMQAGDVIKTSADITKAKNLLNFEPKTKFIDGIKAYVEWANGKE